MSRCPNAFWCRFISGVRNHLAHYGSYPQVKAISTSLAELAGFAGIALKMIDNERRLKAALERQETLTREMSHRIKNVFAVVNAIIHLGARRASSVSAFAESISARIQALSVADGLVRRTFGDTPTSNETGEFGDIVRTVLDPHARTGLSAKGPSVSIGPLAANALALFFHELATNAAKYGALSTEDGCVEVDWKETAGRLVVDWRERGGPPILTPPSSKGFGTFLTESTVKGVVGASVEYDWQPEGLMVSLVAAVEALRR